MRDLIENIDRLHTTELGAERVKKNLGLDTDASDNDVVAWCRGVITDPEACITRRGKNWYVRLDDVLITVNATSSTIITAYRLERECHDRD